MEKSDLEKINLDVKKDLDLQIISGSLLLDKFCVIDERSRKTSAYLDSFYAPFYYHLGKRINPESFLEIGFNIGLLSCCFLSSCKSVKRFLGFKEKSKEFIPTRIGLINIKKFIKNIDVYIGELYDEYLYLKLENKWDLVLINEEKGFDKQLEYMEFVWPYISDNGFLVMEYINSHKPSKDAFNSFCNSKNIKPIIFETRYGTGLINKC